MKKTPLVSVVVPAYNAQEFLCDAINSILAQTLQDFEIIIVNDGSTDQTADILNGISDRRLQVVELGQNLGIAGARNAGLRAVRGKYIAWLDADDISGPDRLRRQVAHLEQESNIGMSGTWVRTFGHGRGSIWRYPRKSPFLGAQTMFDDPFCTSSVMMRSKLVDCVGEFKEGFSVAEDYDYWVRLMRVSNASNVPRVLTRYRIHQQQSSTNRRASLRGAIMDIQGELLRSLNVEPTEQEWEIHLTLGIEWGSGVSRFEDRDVHKWLDKLIEANRDSKVFDQRAFALAVEYRRRLAKQSMYPTPWRMMSIKWSALLQ